MLYFATNGDALWYADTDKGMLIRQGEAVGEQANMMIGKGPRHLRVTVIPNRANGHGTRPVEAREFGSIIVTIGDRGHGGTRNYHGRARCLSRDGRRHNLRVRCNTLRHAGAQQCRRFS